MWLCVMAMVGFLIALAIHPVAGNRITIQPIGSVAGKRGLGVHIHLIMHLVNPELGKQPGPPRARDMEAMDDTVALKSKSVIVLQDPRFA